MSAMELVHATVVQDSCPECRNALLAEAQSLGGLPLEGKVVMIPRHWLNTICPHGHPGLKFDLVVSDTGALSREAERVKSSEIELEATVPRIDATKGIGYPVREHGPYGSHPMHDDFDDESGPNGSGTY
jgi:hypothetical protein